jgi:hypothetical protein
VSPSLPSLQVPDAEKRAYTEADVHAKLFEPDMTALGYPPRTSGQADGEYFLEQRRLAVRRLKTGQHRGFYDGLYLIGNSPIVLCELKRYLELDSDSALESATRQLQRYARSEDFAAPPPFLLLYCGKPDRTRFFRLRPMSEATSPSAIEYESLDLWDWERVKAAHLKGEFAEEVVSSGRLRQILLDHLDRIEDDLRAQVTQAVRVVSQTESPAILPEFARWLVANPEALLRMRELYQRKLAEIARGGDAQVIEEMVTQAGLNYLNKVFFLNLCEDRNLAGFYRIMREFLPTVRTETSATTAAVFMALLRRKIRDQAGEWREQDERTYRATRSELAPEIGDRVISQNNWWELIRVAFDLAEERFPLVYREDAYDYFRPSRETLAELVFDLSTKSFRELTNRNVGDVYQSLLSSRRRGASGRSGRQRQQAKLGAYYTPRGDVEYMVSRLELRRDSKVLDPCMGSGHFLEGIYERLAELYREEGYSPSDAYRQIVGEQIHGADIDTFATSLAAIRLFLLDEHITRAGANLFVHDMLLHSPERPGAELFSAEVLQAEGRAHAEAERAVSVDPEVDRLADVDTVEFDAVVGNPPYGARKPAYKVPIYRRLYGQRAADLGAGSVGTGDSDSYGMFFANGIERLREGGRLCLITNDSFRSLTTHAALRRTILDRCKVVEVLLTDTRHFEGVSFQFAGMAITTLEKCSNAEARAANVIRLVDYMRDPADFSAPPPGKVTELRQEEYEALPETPFFVGVPREVFESAKASGRVRDVARGRVGLQTGDDRRFLAGIDGPYPALTSTVARGEVTTEHSVEEQAHGIEESRPHWVPFAKGEGFGDYWREAQVAIDWSRASVAELERRSRLPSGTPRKTYFRNRDWFFRPGLTYSVISSGRVSARLLPAGSAWSDKGSAIFVEDPGVSELYLLGYLNSALATYFMKKLVNTTATAHAGYVEKLPFRRPPEDVQAGVEERVGEIVESLQANPEADVTGLRAEIDDVVFDLFNVRASREEIRRFQHAVGRAEPLATEAQAASE